MTCYIQTVKVGLSYWKTLWSYLDFGYGLFNMIAAIMIGFDYIITPTLRTMQACTAVIIWLKALYYMQLNDKISPLVAIIFKIFSNIVVFIII